jgi:hypothetical protein
MGGGQRSPLRTRRQCWASSAGRDDRAGFTDGLVPPGGPGRAAAALPLVEVAPLILRSGSR